MTGGQAGGRAEGQKGARREKRLESNILSIFEFRINVRVARGWAVEHE